MTTTELYEIYSKKYDSNLKKVEKYNPGEAARLAAIKMPEEEFTETLEPYRKMMKRLQPTARPSQEDLAKWIANRETKSRSYKQSLKIKAVAAQFGIDLNINEIQFNAENSTSVKGFWKKYEDELDTKGVGALSAYWGSD